MKNAAHLEQGCLSLLPRRLPAQHTAGGQHQKKHSNTLMGGGKGPQQRWMIFSSTMMHIGVHF